MVGDVERAAGVLLEKGELAGVDGAAAQGADPADGLVRVHAKLDQGEGGEDRGATQAGGAVDGDGLREAVDAGGAGGMRVGVGAQVRVGRGLGARGGAGDVLVQAEDVVQQGEPGRDDVGRRGVTG